MRKQLISEPDILGLITRIHEQLFSLDKKLDVVISRSAAQPVAARPFPAPSFQPPKHVPVPGSGRQNDPRQGRPMHRATCADCQKECELPFKPTGDRPVYCKECFAKRRAGNIFKPAGVNKPLATSPVAAVIPAAVNVPDVSAKKKKKPLAAKKSSAKKKPVAKKKKK